jgi:hypothetical protein
VSGLQVPFPSILSDRDHVSYAARTSCVRAEMYELSDLPSGDKVIRGNLNGRGEGIVGVYSGPRVIRLFPGSLIALQESHDRVYPGKLAVASSADTPLAERIGRAAMKLLEVVPGTTVHDVLVRDYPDGRNLQIGRQAPLSSDKSRTYVVPSVPQCPAVSVAPHRQLACMCMRAGTSQS